MENINWCKPTDEDAKCFITEDVFRSYSASHLQLYGLRSPPWGGDHAPKQNNGKTGKGSWDPIQLKREILPGVGGQGRVLKVNLPKPFPRYSVLNSTEQKTYMYSIIHLTKQLLGEIPINPVESGIFQEFQEKLKEETVEFHKFSREIALQNPSIYLTLKPGVKTYITELWKNCLQRVKLYPQHYELKSSVTLIPKENVKQINLVLERKILEIGSIPSKVIPPMNTLVSLSQTYEKVNKRFSTSSHYQPVSCDPNALKLAQKYDVDVVVSSSVLSTLVSTTGPLFKKSWEIPFVVAELKGKDVKSVEQEGKKIIFLDKPLPPKEMTAVEQNKWFNRYSARVQMSRMDHGKCYFYSDSRNIRNENRQASPLNTIQSLSVKNESDVSDNSQIEKIERIQSVVTPEQEGMKENDVVANEATTSSTTLDVKASIGGDNGSTLSSDSDSEAASLVIDLGDTNISPVKRRPKLSKSNILSDILKEQEKTLKSTGARLNPQSATKLNIPLEMEDPKEYVPLKKGENNTYNIWNLNVGGYSLRLLVRTSVHAAATPKGELKTFLIAPKLEYQPWYGAECVTPSEINEEWLATYIRPGSRILRVRVDAYTGNVLMTEQRDASYLKAEAKLHFGAHFNSADCLQTVWAVLSSLASLDLNPGTYLAKHAVLDGITVHVLESSVTGSYDLYKEYEIDPPVTIACNPDEEWIPIDPWTILPVQRALGRPPLTFEPRSEERKVRKRKKPADKKNIQPKTKQQKKLTGK